MLYNHNSPDFDGDDTSFIALPIEGEQLLVHGPRKTNLNIQISQSNERDPKRDARALAMSLATSLDRDVACELTKYLFYEFLADEVMSQTALYEAMKNMTSKKVKTRRSKPIAQEDEEYSSEE